MKWTDSVARRIKLKDLQIVLAVARSRNMGRAAADLAISQPAISKAVGDLEQQLGFKLFDRNRRGVEPTIYGDAVLKSALVIFDELRQGVQALEFLADPTAGEVRIGTTPVLSGGFVPAVIDRLSYKFPRIYFDILHSDVATVLRELRDRKIDVAILPLAGMSCPEDMNEKILLYDRHVAIADAQSAWVRRRKLTWADISDAPWVLPPPEFAVSEYLMGAFKAAGIEPPRITVGTLSLPAHHYLLATGRFLTMLPVSMLQFGAKHLSIKALPLKSPVKPSPVAALTLKNRTVAPIANLFIQCAQEIAGGSTVLNWSGGRRSGSHAS
jgi:DNA-binding transcriptional LysR family regulator